MTILNHLHLHIMLHACIVVQIADNNYLNRNNKVNKKRELENSI